MSHWWRKHFIPSKENAYQPHFLRTNAVLGIFGILIAFEALYLAHTLVLLPSSNYLAAIFSSVLIDQTNGERSMEHIGILTPSAKLEEVAKLKAEDMATNGYFAHISPDGKRDSWYWFKKVGYDYAAAGENLAVNFTDSKDVTEAWMHSPSHRANILGENYTEIGIATARGLYKGKEAIFVVQMFGRPSFIARQIDSIRTTENTLRNIDTLDIASNKRNTARIKSTEHASRQSREASSTVNKATVVAGAETQKLNVVASLSMTGAAADYHTPGDSATSTKLSDNKEKRPTTLETLITSPRQAAGTIYLLIAVIVTLALGLAIFVKIRIQHPHIIANGILLLAITIALILFNAVLGFSRGVI